MEALHRNIAPFPNQHACCALLGDSAREVDFNIASNFGGSSSVFAFGPYAVGDKSLWPDTNLQMQKTISLRMQTLDSLISEKEIDPRKYDHWVIDVQDAGLLVLEGATRSLSFCKAVSLEISTVEVYTTEHYNGKSSNFLRQRVLFHFSILIN